MSKVKERILFFVVGEHATPEETAEILRLAEPVTVPAKGTEGEEGYESEHTETASVDVMSVQKMPADHVVNLSRVTQLAGAVPTNYADAWKAEREASPIGAAWTPSATETNGPAKRKR